MNKATVQTAVGRVTLRQRGRRWYARKALGGDRHEIALGTEDLNEAIDIVREKLPARLLGAVAFSNDSRSIPSAADYQRLFRTAKQRAKAKGLDYTLTPEQEQTIIKRANGFCEVTGIAFSLATSPEAFRAPYRASLDRIDSARGYTFGNVRLVCIAVNWAMADWGIDVFDQIASAYVAQRLLKSMGRRWATKSAEFPQFTDEHSA